MAAKAIAAKAKIEPPGRRSRLLRGHMLKIGFRYVKRTGFVSILAPYKLTATGIRFNPSVFAPAQTGGSFLLYTLAQEARQEVETCRF